MTTPTELCWGGYYCPDGMYEPNPSLYLCPRGMHCPNGSEIYQVTVSFHCDISSNWYLYVYISHIAFYLVTYMSPSQNA